MKTKITQGLVATNGDGKPSRHPRVPAHWSGQSAISPSFGEQDGVKPTSGDSSPLVKDAMSTLESGAAVGSPSKDCTGQLVSIHDGTSVVLSAPLPSSNSDRAAGPSNIEASQIASENLLYADSVTKSLPSVPNHHRVILEEKKNRMEKGQISMVGDSGGETQQPAGCSVEKEGRVSNPDEEMSTAQYIENKVVESFLELPRPDMRNSHRVESGEENVEVMDTNPIDPVYRQGSNDIELASLHRHAHVSERSESRNCKDSSLDPVSMTIASVAAGEGEPPQFLMMPSPNGLHGGDRMCYTASSPSTKHKKNKVEKGNLPASARLPVISSLLAPSGAAAHNAMLPGIQHIAPSGGSSSSPTAVLPSVAHFLGPAKSPPNTYNAHGTNMEAYSAALGGSSDVDESSLSQYQTPKSSKGGRKPVTPAGLRLSMAASEELPDPLPLPQYSEKVMRAKQLGTVAFDRPTVLRETVQFFLQFKHYWSSHDYDRISNLVVELFPEFKDSNETPGVPANKRIRTDLSMYARNFRRREVSQRKKEGSGSGLSATEHTRDPKHGSPTHGVGKSYLQPLSPGASSGQQVAVGTSNATDFCNELLTAASIIERQNSAGAARNGEVNENMHHKFRIGVSTSHEQGEVIHKQEVMDAEEEEEEEGATSNGGNHGPHRGSVDEEEDDNTPIHFVYDKEQMSSNPREVNTAWQIYSDQIAQMAGSSSLEYGISDEVADSTPTSNTDRLSAMAMWRSTALPDPLPSPPYSDSVLRARETGNTMSARPKIIRETTQYFLALKLWWTAPDYERIAELVLQNFPALVSLQAIKKDLGTCARNMRRRLPVAKHKPTSATQKGWPDAQVAMDPPATDAVSQAVATMVPGTAEYMKALMASQNMNLTELGMTQRNLGELAVLAGIKQRIEQHPQDVTDMERQYLAQCSSEEQRQALMASGAFGNDSAAMAALSAFYGQLGVDISGSKRMLSTMDYNSPSAQDGGGGDLALGPNKRQRRISQAEVEKRLREAELNHAAAMSDVGRQNSLTVGTSEKALVKREPMSPSGGEASKTSQSSKGNPQQLAVSNSMGLPVFPTSSAHEQSYWDVQAAANMALMGVASITHSSSAMVTSNPPMATMAHSQAHIQHLSGHEAPDATTTEAPMNLAYHNAEKHSSHNSPIMQDPLPDTAGLAAQVEVTTSTPKQHTPRRRASSSPRSSHQGEPLSSRDQQVWFPHGSGFKKENQEIVCLPDPLPIPSYSQKILAARNEGASMRHRSEIIRETARSFLSLKYWWSSADYTRISELVVQQFPDLKDDTTGDGMTNYRRIQRDLSMCARNLRRSKKPRKIRDMDGNSFSDTPTMPPTVKKSQKTPKSVGASEKKKRIPGSLTKSKKAKAKASHQSPASATVVSKPDAAAGVTEDMTAAAALLQQQFMQSGSSGSFPPNSHLLPSTHLLPSMHQQHMQAPDPMNDVMMPQEGHSVSIVEADGPRSLVKEEPACSNPHENLSHYHTEVKSNTPASKPATPPVDTGQPEEGDVGKQSGRTSQLREVEAAAMSKAEQEKAMALQTSQNNKKTYVDPDHGTDLQERFANLWKRGKFFDASLGVANKKLHVHKLILLAMSPYLQETFKNADPRSQLEVNLPSDTTFETAKAFLRYIYEGVLEVDTSSVRSLYKIASMLQMTKLAQYCQNFAQLLQEEAEDVTGGAGEGEIPKISVNLGEFAEMQRQRVLEAQAIQRLGETNTISSSDLQRSTSRYHHMAEDDGQLKADYMNADPNSVEASNGNQHYLHQDVLAQHRALVAATSASSSLLLPPSSQDSLLQVALARNHTSPPVPSSSSSSLYQHQQHMVSQADANAALLHRLTSPDSTVPSTLSTSALDQQQRLAIAAYWQAHTFELMSRNQVPGLNSEPSNFNSASELAAIAAAAAATSSEDTRHLFSSLGHETKVKVPSLHSGRAHHSKDSPWSSHSGESESTGHQATMLPETCIPVDMARQHQVANTEGTT